MSDKIEKFPFFKKVYGSPSIEPNEDLADIIEEVNKIFEWRVQATETLEKRLLTIIQARDEAGTKVTMIRFHTLLNEVLESLKSE